jgi:hypothetical protein
LAQPGSIGKSAKHKKKPIAKILFTFYLATIIINKTAPRQDYGTLELMARPNARNFRHKKTPALKNEFCNAIKGQNDMN